MTVETLEAIRGAGLAHLLAISGLHMAMVAAIAFFTVRALLAAVEPVALRFPIKTWAAMAALAASFFYLLLSGATVSAQRAFVMTTIVLVAVAIGRQAISMRLVALAAVVIMAAAPHAVNEPGFQLSFAVVVALVAAYEALRDRWAQRRDDEPLPRFLLYPAGVALTAAIAMAATLLPALARFGSLAIYGGLLANLLAVPVVASWVMPWGMAVLVLMPQGLQGWALEPMAWGIEAILRIAEAADVGAPLIVLGTPPWFSLAYGMALIWLCVWRHRWRLLALVPLAGLLAVLAMPPSTPDPLVAGDAGPVAARTGEEEVAFSGWPPEFLGLPPGSADGGRR